MAAQFGIRPTPPAVLSSDPKLHVGQLTATSSFLSRRSNTLLWPLWTPLHMGYTHTMTCTHK